MPYKTGKTILKNYRLPFVTVKQLQELAAAGNTTMTTVLVKLIQQAREGKEPVQPTAS